MEVIDSGTASAEVLMKKDKELLESLCKDGPLILHFYEWEKSTITYGYFIDPSEHLWIDTVLEEQIHLVKRPTGGGITFHFKDFAYSVLVPADHPLYSPNTLENYKTVNHLISKAFGKTFSLAGREKCQDKKGSPFCLANPAPFDLMVGKKKTGGSAQRKTRNGFLHQGNIAIKAPPIELLKKLVKNPEILTASETPFEWKENRETIKLKILEQFQD